MKKLLSVFIILVLLAACADGSANPSVSSLPDLPESLPEFAVFHNQEGQRLYLGMSCQEFKEVIGVEIEDLWSTIIPMATDDNPEDAIIAVASTDGVITGLAVSVNGWATDSGVEIGMNFDEATKDFGPPEKEQGGGAEYSFMIFNIDDAYVINTIEDTDGKLIFFGVSIKGTPDETQRLGIKTLLGHGVGNSQFTSTSDLRQYLHVTHSGEDEFKISINSQKANELVLVDRVGEYDSRIFSPSTSDTNAFSVVADGEWTIWLYMYALEPKFCNDTSFFGDGDYATLYLDPQKTEILGTWKVKYDGDGEFILKLTNIVREYDLPSGDTIELVNVEGQFSGEIQIEEDMLHKARIGQGLSPVVFEIFAEGDWSIEKLF